MVRSPSAKYTMTASQWSKWAMQRRADAQKLEKLYEAQSNKVLAMITNWGCECDPVISVHSGPDGPVIKDPLVTHALFCTRP